MESQFEENDVGRRSVRRFGTLLIVMRNTPDVGDVLIQPQEARALRWVPLGIYSMGFFLVLALSYAAPIGAVWIYDRLPADFQNASWLDWAINGLAPTLGGLVAGGFLVRLLVRKGWFRATVLGHFFRSIVWYAFAAWVVYVVTDNMSSPDFGLWSQVVIWPFFGICAALAVDILSSVVVARRGTVPTA